MTDFHNIPSDPTEPANPVEGFVFMPAGSDVAQVWQKINGQYVRTDNAIVHAEAKVTR
ncbi:hypothetical protein [Bradyrhizobium sp. 187]|uniref:hypothetical protein n=1 Tax=Bradyrhizobium sp. 187 TaxID=2782655 RepID=UPI0020003819|nr:hypothetical protein [Bradyrhizobium sp. 187]UPJ69864.1 hypothetical protein IVB19_19180 [Bradyrhizobium sp. 187]